jgi:CheY-like chemotaxis protein
VNKLPAPELGFAPKVGRRVLVVDDREDARLILRLLLAKLGHEVRTAEDGPCALAVCREFKPDVIFCDLCLGEGMSGYDFARAARRSDYSSTASLVAVSGYDDDHSRDEAARSGFDRSLQKPVSLQDLQRILADPPRASSGSTA